MGNYSSPILDLIAGVTHIMETVVSTDDEEIADAAQVYRPSVLFTRLSNVRVDKAAIGDLVARTPDWDAGQERE